LIARQGGLKKMKWIFGFICTLALTGPGQAASWETTSLRTASGALVRVGMPSEEARKELGQPPRAHGESKKSGRKEMLTYRGADGLYTITLSGGQVAKIVVTPKRD
jgi:hypothetical protein